jgi:hypothetical protein
MVAMKVGWLLPAIGLTLLGAGGGVLAGEPAAGASGMAPLEVAHWKYPPSDPLNAELYRRLNVRIAQVTKYGSNPATDDPLWIVRLADQLNESIAAERLTAFLTEVAARKRAQDAALARQAARQTAEDEFLEASGRTSPFGSGFRGLQTSYPLFDGALRGAGFGGGPRLGAPARPLR